MFRESVGVEGLGTGTTKVDQCPLCEKEVEVLADHLTKCDER